MWKYNALCSEEALGPDTAPPKEDRSGANRVGLKIQAFYSLLINVLSREPLISEGREAAAAGWLKLQRMSNDRQLWLCVSGQRLLLLIACYFEGNHQSFPLGLWGERQQAVELRGRSLSGLSSTFPVIPLDRNRTDLLTKLSRNLCPQVPWGQETGSASGWDTLDSWRVPKHPGTEMRRSVWKNYGDGPAHGPRARMPTLRSNLFLPWRPPATEQQERPLCKRPHHHPAPPRALCPPSSARQARPRASAPTRVRTRGQETGHTGVLSAPGWADRGRAAAGARAPEPRQGQLHSPSRSEAQRALRGGGCVPGCPSRRSVHV